MTQESMQGFRCWSAGSVGRTVFSDIGALASDADAIFLAAHTPVQLEHRKGPEINDRGSGEAQVLEAITGRIGDLERNTLVAVTGGSGSGKSHVVRWVHAHLNVDDPRFKVLYVPRAVQTLRELLRQIIEGLPGVEGAELMNRVDTAIAGLKAGELQDRLISEMKIALNWTLEERSAHEGETDEEAAVREDRNSLLGYRGRNGGRRDGLADLLEVPAVKASLLRTDGRLNQLVQSYFTETSRRGDNEEIFTRDDLPLRERGVLGALATQPELRELWQIIIRQPEDALALLEEALRVALPRTVGLWTTGGDTLGSLFHTSRKVLREEGQDLLFLFEDLTQFGLVEGELYDHFVTPPGEELAPVRAVFAVTDGAFGRMERTVRTRVEHEFCVGDSALSQPDQFLGRYLNLVRVGRDQTQALWNSAPSHRADGQWMINACDTREQGQPCRFRDKCHEAFGTVSIDGLGDVGLYPYNSTSMRRAIQHVGGQMTPRDALDECITTNLVEADTHIERGDYPHERTRHQFDFRVRMGRDALLARYPSSDPERTYRALVIWGDESALPAGVLKAFSLDETLSPPATNDTPVVSETRPVSSGIYEHEAEELPNLLLPLFQWANGEKLPEDEGRVLRNTLYELTFNRLHLDQSLVHIYSGRGQELLNELFNMTSFSIEGVRGRPAGAQSIRFKVTRSPEDVQLLAAARWFRDHGHFNPAQATWEWPEGYDPLQLMLGLETRLDQWAVVVRERFLEVAGSRLAGQAVGVRALALAASGRDITKVGTARDVLADPTGPRLKPTAAWRSVEEIASGIVETFRADEYVGEFAAVRQGETGQPQVVDTRDLDEAVRGFVQDPRNSLEEVASQATDPVLAQAARQLLNSVAAAVEGEAKAVTHAQETATTLLEGISPVAVGQAADEVGQSARDAGLFRPPDRWMKFREEVELLVESEPELPRISESADFRTVLMDQPLGRRLARLAEALTLVKDFMGSTREECARSGKAVGDLSALQKTAKSQVDELKTLVSSLSWKGQA